MSRDPDEHKYSWRCGNVNTGLMNTRTYLHEVKISGGFFFTSVGFVVCSLCNSYVPKFSV